MVPNQDEPGRDDRAMILVIDHDQDTVDHLMRMLHEAGYRATRAEDGRTGINIAEKYRPNAILMDLDLPGTPGLEVCKELKNRLVTTDTPVIFITRLERTDDLISRCFDAGAHDFLAKPVNKVDLLARVRVVLREQAIREAYRRLAVLDPLTGLANRRQFFMYLTEAVMSARRTAKPSCLVLADIDGLSLINQRYGHEFGDEVILTFSRLVRRLISHTCRAGRIGGEEFGIALADCTPDRAVSLAQRLGQTFASIAFDASSEPKHFYAGFGIACYDGRPQAFDADQLMSQADVALYSAKEAGHGRVVGYWTLDPKALPAIAPNKRHARSRTRRRTQRSFLGAPVDDNSVTPGPVTSTSGKKR